MTAIGESTLRVLDVGDAVGPDSRGLFQQRAGGAWGSYQDRMDPFISASNFFTKLAAIPGRANLAPTLVAHQVQGNADPEYYTPFWADAGRIVQALTGQVSTANASTGAPSAQSSAASSRYQLGAVLPHTALVANTLGPMFGITTVGGYRAAGAGDTNYDPAGHPAGRALDFMLTGSNARTTGDKLAAYAQANAKDLDVTYLIWRQRIWSVDRADEAWRPMPDRGAATANHLDHVHISLGPGWAKAGSPEAPASAASGASCAAGSLTAGQVQPGGWAPPARGPILSTFGPRVDPVRGAAGYGFHYGIDIGSACNNPIWAAHAGTVVRAGIETTGLGNVIEIDHGNGVETRYGHMYDNGVLTHVGDQVAGGQQIGRIGSNGNSTGCHLHFEARADGTGTLDLDGATSTVTAESMDQARRQLLHLVAGHARATGRAVTVLARAEHLLRVAPDGQVEPVETPPSELATSNPGLEAGAAARGSPMSPRRRCRHRMMT